MGKLEDKFYNWLKDNQKQLHITDDEITELVKTLDYMIGDSCIGWEYDYQYNIKMDLDRRIAIINAFDNSLLDY